MDDDRDISINTQRSYVTQKLEINTLCNMFIGKWGKIIIIFIMAVYMYGAMMIKCVSASESLGQALSFLFWHDRYAWGDKMGFDPYYLCIIIFAATVSIFSVGNIENSKWLQIIVAFLRLFTWFLMVLGSIIAIYLIDAPVCNIGNTDSVKGWDFSQMDYIFGNTIFINMFHHSIPGIFYPMRPQKRLRNTGLICFLIGTSMLLLEGILSEAAFGCRTKDDNDYLDCRIQVLICIYIYIYTYIYI